MFTEHAIYLYFFYFWTDMDILENIKRIKSGVNAEMYCKVCMWPMSTCAVTYVLLLLVFFWGFFLFSPLSYACPCTQTPMLILNVNRSILHTFPIWLLTTCISVLVDIAADENNWARRGKVFLSIRRIWVRCVVHMTICLDASLKIFAFSNAWFYPHIFPSAMGVLWLAHFLLPVHS